MSKTVITIEHLEGGQRGAYADSRYRANVKAERHGIYTDGRVLPFRITKDEVKQLARRFVHGWADDPDWHQARLESVRPIISPDTLDGTQRSAEWEVLIVQPYLG